MGGWGGRGAAGPEKNNKIVDFVQKNCIHKLLSLIE